ncbi:MAG: HlyD family efflux transporter periplasmic adaptor subunit, partial [Cyanobium sp. MAG_04]|nr:HlyD family efflux transporter periplasmic adaptor subunit [Cyanobium sp. MAG_04]
MPIPLLSKSGQLFRRAQNALEQRVQQSHHDGELLQQSRFWARAITWSLIGTTAFGVGWLALARTEEIVVAPGKLEPMGGVQDIRLPVGGVVEQVLIKNGQRVKQGEVLLRLDTEATADRQQSLTKTIDLKQQQLVSKEEELQRYLELNRAQVSVLQRNLALERQIEGRLESLTRVGASAELQYLQQRNKVQEVAGQLEQTRVDRFRQEAILAQQAQQLRSELADIRSKLTELNVNLRYQEVRSPVDGVVFDLKPTGPGFVAQTSEPVLKIVPFDKLEARVEIASSDIGFVSVGKAVDISIDSFPASDFGVMQGTVRRIGSDALPPDQLKQIYRFPADIQLDSQQ